MSEKIKVVEKKPYQVIIETSLLRKAQAKAEGEGLKLSQVIRRYLMDYVANPQGKLFN